MPRDDTENMKKALSILEGQQETPENILDLAKILKKEKRFGLGWKLMYEHIEDFQVAALACGDDYYTDISLKPDEIETAFKIYRKASNYRNVQKLF